MKQEKRPESRWMMSWHFIQSNFKWEKSMNALFANLLFAGTKTKKKNSNINSAIYP